jgi:4-hydroxybenzoate polyprenyltransferase
MERWWVYQRERFPLLSHGLLIAVFSFSAISYSCAARGSFHVPQAGTLVVGFLSSLLFFLQLRIADEFKDFDEDCRFRPYRAVPRGLVGLRELGILGVLGGVVQLCLALLLTPALLPLLLLVWLYLALMSKEFFVRTWLRARPVTYMWTHMLILALVDLYVTSCDWRVAGVSPPRALVPFLVVSFCNGIVLEVGRKIRAPQDEEEGVQTYSALWGRSRAVTVWLGAMAATACVGWMAAWQVGFPLPAGLILMALLVAAGSVGTRFLREPRTDRARWIERTSGIWTVMMYASIGAAPLLSRAW